MKKRRNALFCHAFSIKIQSRKGDNKSSRVLAFKPLHEQYRPPWLMALPQTRIPMPISLGMWATLHDVQQGYSFDSKLQTTPSNLQWLSCYTTLQLLFLHTDARLLQQWSQSPFSQTLVSTCTFPTCPNHTWNNKTSFRIKNHFYYCSLETFTSRWDKM